MFGCLIGHHLVFEGDQYGLECGFRLPVLEDIEVFDSTVGLVDTGDANLSDEGNLRWLSGVVGATHDLQTVNSAIKAGLS